MSCHISHFCFWNKCFVVAVDTGAGLLLVQQWLSRFTRPWEPLQWWGLRRRHGCWGRATLPMDRGGMGSCQRELLCAHWRLPTSPVTSPPPPASCTCHRHYSTSHMTTNWLINSVHVDHLLASASHLPTTCVHDLVEPVPNAPKTCM